MAASERVVRAPLGRQLRRLRRAHLRGSLRDQRQAALPPRQALRAGTIERCYQSPAGPGSLGRNLPYARGAQPHNKQKKAHRERARRPGASRRARRSQQPRKQSEHGGITSEILFAPGRAAAHAQRRGPPGRAGCYRRHRRRAAAGNANNELTTGPAGTYSYDANGNQLGNSAGLKLAYNAKNQTTSITPAGQSATSLTYLGAGQASLTGIGSATQVNDLLGVGYRTDSTGTTYYTHDNNRNLLSERSPGGGYYYYVPDAQGSILALTDSSGSASNSYSYDPYGQTTSSTGTTPNVWGYQQGEQGPAGTYHFGQRYYDPTTGRWTQQDPLNQIGDPTQVNGYAFASANPLHFTDPSGQISLSFSATGCLIVCVKATVSVGPHSASGGLGTGVGLGASVSGSVSSGTPRSGWDIQASGCGGGLRVTGPRLSVHHE